MQNYKEVRLELDPNKILHCLDDNGVLIHEEFKFVNGYNKKYQASSFGRVKSFMFNKTKILKQSKASLLDNRYSSVSLSLNKKPKRFEIHQLIAIVFLNHKPDGHKIVVDHKDNDPNNNKLNNLQLVTHRKNCIKDRTGYASKYVGVYWNKNVKKWHVRIQIKGVNKTLGYFKNEDEAGESYLKALSEIKH
jgi:hypothetical protein